MDEKKQRSAASPIIGADMFAGIEEAQRAVDQMRNNPPVIEAQSCIDDMRSQAEPMQAELERKQSPPARDGFYFASVHGGRGLGRTPEAAIEQAKSNARVRTAEMELEAAKLNAETQAKARKKTKVKRGTAVSAALVELGSNPRLNDSEVAKLVGCAPSTLCTSKRFQQGAAAIREQCDNSSLTRPVRRSRRDNTRTNQDPEPSTSRRASEDPMADVDARLDAEDEARNTKKRNSK